jgi:hypothetical protein
MAKELLFASEDGQRRKEADIWLVACSASGRSNLSLANQSFIF